MSVDYFLTALEGVISDRDDAYDVLHEMCNVRRERPCEIIRNALCSALLGVIERAGCREPGQRLVHSAERACDIVQVLQCRVPVSTKWTRCGVWLMVNCRSDIGIRFLAGCVLGMDVVTDVPFHVQLVVVVEHVIVHSPEIRRLDPDLLDAVLRMLSGMLPAYPQIRDRIEFAVDGRVINILLGVLESSCRFFQPVNTAAIETLVAVTVHGHADSAVALEWLVFTRHGLLLDVIAGVLQRPDAHAPEAVCSTLAAVSCIISNVPDSCGDWLGKKGVVSGVAHSLVHAGNEAVAHDACSVLGDVIQQCPGNVELALEQPGLVDALTRQLGRQAAVELCVELSYSEKMSEADAWACWEEAVGSLIHTEPDAPAFAGLVTLVFHYAYRVSSEEVPVSVFRSLAAKFVQALGSCAEPSPGPVSITLCREFLAVFRRLSSFAETYAAENDPGQFVQSVHRACAQFKPFSSDVTMTHTLLDVVDPRRIWWRIAIREAIASFPTVTDSGMCCLCMCADEHPAPALSCGHLFHASCLMSWAQETTTGCVCPICNGRMFA